MKTAIIIIGVLIVVFLAGFAGYRFSEGKQQSNTNTNSSESANSTNQSESNTPETNGKTSDYTNKGLTEFPKAILSDKSIVVLDLSNNNLTGALPAEIRQLQNLESLNVSNNQMTGIPAEIGQLKKLKILNYANNQITGLPLELGNLTQLEILDLSGNNVSQQDLAQIRAKLVNTDIRL